MVYTKSKQLLSVMINVFQQKTYYLFFFYGQENLELCVYMQLVTNYNKLAFTFLYKTVKVMTFHVYKWLDLCKESKRELNCSWQNMEARFMMMAAGHSRNFILMLMLMQVFAVLLGVHAVEEWKTLSEEENLEMERQLKVINKPPIKSFRTEHGDILDCIDMYKQHAFDHPLLKDHKIQMRPKRIPKEMKGGKSPRLLPKNIRCPPGSVLIKRTTKEDLIMAKKIKALGLNYPTSSRFHNTGAAPNGFGTNPRNIVSAYAEYTKHNFGAKATMNVWNPRVSPNQFSFSNIWIANGPLETVNAIQAGWGVQPSLFSSNYTRLITLWTADGYKNTGCYNYLCPGFVQVSSEISLGLVLKEISTYNGTQADIEISIFKDGEWWFTFFNKVVGYWPEKVFTYMYGGANFVFWGGQVYSPSNEPSPEMGSGHFPQDGHDRKSGYFKQLQLWDNVNFVYPDGNFVKVNSDKPQCYNAQTTPDGDAIDLFYGGPGQLYMNELLNPEDFRKRKGWKILTGAISCSTSFTYMPISAKNLIKKRLGLSKETV
ncbi:uncharacterized protein LOC111290082 [Durio zibethinus]|uniref:Uncharacterized protein LOC111290082 n=1 Tax=Durio zibethinus TaxID=66656 RepID=A0A6P5Y9T3_DURZI|nr:uncharacterized protein LOC111290082 [Durio zibethinus]